MATALALASLSTAKAETPKGEGGCLDELQMRQVAIGLHELEVCKKTLALREQFIETIKISATPETAWWQEPTVVVGGVVVGLAVGGIVGFLVAAGR